MDENTLLEAYEPFEFYETEIEGSSSALIYEPIDNEDYALITDVDGIMPVDLEQEIIFAAYTADGAFAWSVGFESSLLLLELLTKHSKSDNLINIVKSYRDDGDYY